MPPPCKEWWRGNKCYPCPCVRPCVRLSVIKIWCPLNNFWKTASIPFIFGMLIYNITGRVRFGLQSTNFWRSFGPFIKNIANLARASVSYGHISSLDKICIFSADKPKASFIYLVLPICKLVLCLDFSSY